MTYSPIDADKDALTIMGVRFRDLKTLEDVASDIGSNMFGGFVPTRDFVELFRDYIEGKVPRSAITALIREQL
jgi:putative transcriptional regulator